MQRPARHGAAIALAASLALWGGEADAQEKVNTITEIGQRLMGCWKSPRLPGHHQGIEITFQIAFTRAGEILGKPKVTYESGYASDEDRLLYRTALAEALQRCAPMPFTEGLGNAIAGRPLRLRIDDRRAKPT